MTPRIVVSPGPCGGPAASQRRALARRVRRAARAMGCARGELDGIELRIVGDDEMRAIKLRSFGIAEATDVLSFPAEPLPGEPTPVLGELVLNRDAVRRQARRPDAAGWLDEATSLAIHGVAHLLGHDHGERHEARRMRACERRGCAAVGLPCDRPYGS